MDKISLKGLRTVLQTGGVRAVGVTGSGGMFFVTVQPRSGEWLVLATGRERQVRGFRDLGRAVLLLHGLGVSKIALDVSAWEPGRADGEKQRRPDVAVRQKRLHGAAQELARMRGDGET